MFLTWYSASSQLKYTIADRRLQPIVKPRHRHRLAFDAHRRLHFLTEKAAADFDESIGGIGDKETVDGLTALFWSTRPS